MFNRLNLTYKECNLILDELIALMNELDAKFPNLTGTEAVWADEERSMAKDAYTKIFNYRNGLKK